MADQLDRIRDELFALCEDTEDAPDGSDFARGRKYEAKRIRQTMGEIIRMAKAEAQRN